MNHEQPKGPRKLQMLPEVLPAPAPLGTSDVRTRTMHHMRRLVATATAVAAAGCSREAGSNTVTIPAASSTGPASGAATTPLPPLHSATAVATATATAPQPDIGYAVVDPMPAPARCMGLAPASKVTATVKHDAANGLVVEITLALATTGTWAGTTFDKSSAPSPWGGTLVGAPVFHGAQVTAKVKPTLAAGATQASIGVTFPIACTAGNGNLSFNTTIPLPMQSGAKLTSRLNDY